MTHRQEIREHAMIVPYARGYNFDSAVEEILWSTATFVLSVTTSHGRPRNSRVHTALDETQSLRLQSKLKCTGSYLLCLPVTRMAAALISILRFPQTRRTHITRQQLSQASDTNASKRTACTSRNMQKIKRY